MHYLIPHLLFQPTSTLTHCLNNLQALFLAQRKTVVKCPLQSSRPHLDTRYISFEVETVDLAPVLLLFLYIRLFYSFSAAVFCFQYGEEMLTAGESGQTGMFWLPSPGVTADCVDTSPAGSCYSA